MIPPGRAQAETPPLETIAGMIERVTFHNAETGFAVLRVKARGQRDLVTVVGHAALIAAGEWIEEPEAAVQRIITLVRDRIPARFTLDPIRDVQVLCPMTRGAIGSRSLNATLQAALNAEATPRIERFGNTYAPGDKVMQLENDYDRNVFNGDVGFVSAINSEEGELTATFDGRPVTYSFNEIDALTLSYAATIHKSQGSEYPAVIIPVMTQHYTMLQRNLLYTGVTRGKRLVVLVGQRKAIAIAVRTIRGRQRWTRLGELLGDIVRP